MSSPYIQRAKIISGFPGIGKSHFCNPVTPKEKLPPGFGGHHSIDLETVTFKYMADGVTIKPEFPGNFISYVRDRASRPGVLMIPAHQVILEGLGLAFTAVYPLAQLKPEYLARYVARGSPQPMIDSLEKNWDTYVTNCQKQRGCEHVMLEAGQFLADRIDEVMGRYDYDAADNGVAHEKEAKAVLAGGDDGVGRGAFGSLGGQDGARITIDRSSGTTISIGGQDFVPARTVAGFGLADVPLVWKASLCLLSSLLLLAFIIMCIVIYLESQERGIWLNTLASTCLYSH